MVRRGLVVLAALAAALPAAAHHSFAMFDMQSNLVKPGIVTEFKWTNPHSWMHVDIEGENWAIEMTSPNNLVHGGWKRSSLKPGDKVKVEYHPLRNGKQGGALVQVTLADGTVLKNS